MELIILELFIINNYVEMPSGLFEQKKVYNKKPAKVLISMYQSYFFIAGKRNRESVTTHEI